jgi:hypothetical protein
LARYNINETLDSSFGTGGKVVTNVFAFPVQLVAAMAIQSDSKIVVAGGPSSRLVQASGTAPSPWFAKTAMGLWTTPSAPAARCSPIPIPSPLQL